MIVLVSVLVCIIIKIRMILLRLATRYNITTYSSILLRTTIYVVGVRTVIVSKYTIYCM